MYEVNNFRKRMHTWFPSSFCYIAEVENVFEQIGKFIECLT